MDVLISWLWQGLLVAGGIDLALRVAPRMSASTRYAVWWVALAVVLGMPWMSLSGSVAPKVAMVEVAMSGVAAGSSGGAPIQLPAPPDELTAVAIGLWLIVVACRLTGLGWGVSRLQAIKRTSVALPDDREARLAGWCAVRSTGRSVQVRLASDVRTASLLGLTAPVIAIPPALAGALDDGDLDRVVLHEYAHVRRWDDWARLIQMIVEVVVAFHPAVWLIGRRLDLEREVACDDWVLGVGTASRDYATCLTKVADVMRAGRVGLAPGITHSRRSLVARVDRLLDRRRSLSVRVSGGAVLACFGGLGVAVFAFGQLSPVVAFERAVIMARVDRVELGPVPGGPWGRPVVDAVAKPASAVEPVVLVPAATERERVAPRVEVVASSSASSTPTADSGSNDVGRSVGARRPLVQPASWERPMPAPLDTPTWRAGVMAETLQLPDPSRPSRGPWAWTAVVAASVGGGTKRASVATAGYFTRVGKSIARAF